MTFIINGETPAKKNNRITLTNGRTIPSDAYRAWHAAAVLQFRRDYPECFKHPPLSKPCRVSITLCHKDRTRRDPDNQATSILDFLQDVNILADDNWQIVQQLEVKNIYDPKTAPFAGVEINEL